MLSETFSTASVEHKPIGAETKTKSILCASERETHNYLQALNNGKQNILRNINFCKIVPTS